MPKFQTWPMGFQASFHLQVVVSDVRKLVHVLRIYDGTALFNRTSSPRAIRSPASHCRRWFGGTPVLGNLQIGSSVLEVQVPRCILIILLRWRPTFSPFDKRSDELAMILHVQSGNQSHDKLENPHKSTSWFSSMIRPFKFVHISSGISHSKPIQSPSFICKPIFHHHSSKVN